MNATTRRAFLAASAALALVVGCDAAPTAPSRNAASPSDAGNAVGPDQPETTWRSGMPGCSEAGFCSPRWGHISDRTLAGMNQAAVQVGCADPALLSAYPEDSDGSYWFTCADGRWLGDYPTPWWRDRAIVPPTADLESQWTPIGDRYVIVTPADPTRWPTPGGGPF